MLSSANGLHIPSLRFLSSRAAGMALEQSAAMIGVLPWHIQWLPCLRQTRSTAVHGSSTAFDNWLAENPLPAQALSPANRALESISKEVHHPLQGLRPLIIPQDETVNVRADSSAGDYTSSEDNYLDGNERAESDATSYGPDTIVDIRGESIHYSDMHSVFRSLLSERDFVWDAKRGRFITSMAVCPSFGPTSQQTLFRLTGHGDGGKCAGEIEVIPPLIQQPPAGTIDAAEFLAYLDAQAARGGLASDRHLAALLSSSSAALGIFQDGRLIKHKVVTAYTVRAQQGKSQLKHLREGGSRGGMSVGGGIRARESRRLFVKFNEKLREWEGEVASCELLLYSGDMRAWNEVYACREPVAVVDRKDPRWRKLPLSVGRPRLKELTRAWYAASHGRIIDLRK